MTEHAFQLLAIAVYLAGMLAIGYFAFRKTNDLDDYMLAGRELKPGVAALSAGASDMSGWLIMGLPGAIYLSGLVEAWIAIGLTIGAWLNWKFVAPRLRSYTAISQNAITIPSFFEKRLKENSHWLRIASSLIILVFFTFYVSSGMVAAGKFFEASFSWPYLVGMGVVTIITLTYTLFGGFIGATLTDVAQGILMFAALIVVPIIAVVQTGGVGATVTRLQNIDPDNLNLFAGFGDGNALVWAVGIFSTAAWGLGYFGQPHIIVRFMALRSPQDAKVGRRIGIGWMVLAATGAVCTALVGIGYFAENPSMGLDDPETVFLRLSQIFFHPFVAGLVLAAVLAAIMSTISSQLIVCSSALVEDLYNMTGRESSPKRQVALGRLGVLVVAVIAAVIALDREASILELVSFAWAGFGAAFGPIVLLSLYWRKLTARGALVGMIVGTIVVFAWGKTPVLHDAMYEIVPAFLINLLLAVVISKMTYKKNPVIEEEFTAMLADSSDKKPVMVAAE
ncbi:sodium/proline symporter PutP [Arthrobacter antibioticus]|uniref:sodium/proline symporter PutP n=1 Tax=Arthrobacter sp. H35-MC1 TaxID=3046203 RepID=UPI0024BB3786|nr:sodium/proline symporter PutP [Arthrobacter sp. H35-MC1]MDJ0317321.1 sodium/proline symporter PutP [Arthrobacter sp. H35-MC1]